MEKELVLRRTFDAPIELVWKAWTDQNLVKRWWGPKGVTNPVCRVDPRPGGQMEIVMLAGKELGSFAGMRWPMKGIFTRLKEPELIVFTATAIDDKKDAMIETETTVKLNRAGKKTEMTMHIIVRKTNGSQAAAGALAGMEIGWTQSIDKLAALAAGGIT